MPTLLTEVEARILGSLIEKSFTTPDQYPLSINALVNACNQKSSRDPVMNLDEATVARGLATLQEKNLVSRRNEPGSRVTKFMHRVENLINGGNAQEVGAVCVLLLRGAQTPGEIKTRTDRLCEFSGPAEVEGVLHELSTRSDGPFVVRMARQTGQKESRYMHLFFGPDAVTGAAPAPTVKGVAGATYAPVSGESGTVPTGLQTETAVPERPQPARPVSRASSSDERLDRLEKRVERLENLLRSLGSGVRPRE